MASKYPPLSVKILLSRRTKEFPSSILEVSYLIVKHQAIDNR